jgi:hypothetical protein
MGVVEEVATVFRRAWITSASSDHPQLWVCRERPMGLQAPGVNEDTETVEWQPVTHLLPS